MPITPKEIVMTFVLLVIGASLVGPVGETVFLALRNSSQGGPSNVTGASASILGLLTLFFVIIIIIIAVKKIRD